VLPVIKYGDLAAFNDMPSHQPNYRLIAVDSKLRSAHEIKTQKGANNYTNGEKKTIKPRHIASLAPSLHSKDPALLCLSQ
jgi:hypothetical protein